MAITEHFSIEKYSYMGYHPMHGIVFELRIVIKLPKRMVCHFSAALEPGGWSDIWNCWSAVSTTCYWTETGNVLLGIQCFVCLCAWICECMWVRSRNCGCLVTWFCYQLIAKPGNKKAAVSWPDPCVNVYWNWCIVQTIWLKHLYATQYGTENTAMTKARHTGDI